MDFKGNYYQSSKQGSKPIIHSNRTKVNSNYDLKRYRMLNHINKKKNSKN